MAQGDSNTRAQWKRRVPLLMVLAIGFFVFKGGCGYLASDRTVTVRLPVPASEIRQIELQIFENDTLLKRADLPLPAGLSEELQTTLPMTRGPHHVLVWVSTASTRTLYRADFDPLDESALVVSPLRQ